MLKAELWNKSVPRVELDQRARDARLRLERIGRPARAARCIDPFPAPAAPLSFHRRPFRQRVARRPKPRAAEQSAAPPSPNSGGLARSVRFVLSHVRPFVLPPLRRIRSRRRATPGAVAESRIAIRLRGEPGRSRQQEPRRPRRPGYPSCRILPRCGCAQILIEESRASPAVRERPVP